MFDTGMPAFLKLEEWIKWGIVRTQGADPRLLRRAGWQGWIYSIHGLQLSGGGMPSFLIVVGWDWWGVGHADGLYPYLVWYRGWEWYWRHWRLRKPNRNWSKTWFLAARCERLLRCLEPGGLPWRRWRRKLWMIRGSKDGDKRKDNWTVRRRCWDRRCRRECRTMFQDDTEKPESVSRDWLWNQSSMWRRLSLPTEVSLTTLSHLRTLTDSWSQSTPRSLCSFSTASLYDRSNQLTPLFPAVSSQELLFLRTIFYHPSAIIPRSETTQREQPAST